MHNSDTKHAVLWCVQGMEFHFLDSDKYENWKLRPTVGFKFNASRTWDGGRAIFLDTHVADSCSYLVRSPFGRTKIRLAEKGPVITAMVMIWLPARSNIDEETLRCWSKNLWWS